MSKELEEDINTALDILIDDCINNKEMTATAFVHLKQPTLLLFHKLLADRGRLQRENKEIDKQYQDLQENICVLCGTENCIQDCLYCIKNALENEYVSKDVIKEKIKKYKQLVDKYIELKEYDQVDINLYKINVLKEILEESE